MILWVSRQPLPASVALGLPEDLAHRVSGDFFGTPNLLSPKAIAWPIIGRAAAAVEKGITSEVNPAAAPKLPESDAVASPRATDVIRQRRSAVQFNPHRSIDDRTLFDILGRTIAGHDTPPFSAAPPPGPVELVVFVHQVDGLEPGIYLLKRSGQALENLRSAWTEPFLWEPVPCPLPLWRLKTGDVTDLAATLSCQQDIAGQSAFAVAMIAPFEHVLRPAPYRYRHLHWECGMIGQVLYLAAEAHGLRGTGIGCYFDDEVHRLLGIRDTSYQTLYHFTVGHAIDDDRLSTLPAYHHLERSDS
jgi:nitroreductase